MKKLLICISVICLLILPLTACSETQPENNTDNAPVSIVTTIFPVYDWVKNITGSDNGVIYLDGNGTDMHSFEPTAQDIIRLSQADIFICIGGVSDEWVDAAVSSSGNKNLTVLKLIDITGGLAEESVDGMQTDEHHHDADTSELDEHIWLSVRNAKKCVDAITENLCRINPSDKEVYLKNADIYINKLTDLDNRFLQITNSASNKTLLFADRFPFRYFAEDYGIDYYAAFPGCSAESEASFETLTFLIEKTKELQLGYIIVLENSDGRLAATIADETGAAILTLNSCQSITEKEISDGKTYLSVMEENLAILTEALS